MRVKGFVEKPRKRRRLVTSLMQVYTCFPQRLEKFLKENLKRIMVERKQLDFGYDFIPYLIEKGYPVYGYPIEVWYDVGTIERYLTGNVGYSSWEVRHKSCRSRESYLTETCGFKDFSQESIKRREEIISKYKEKKLFIEGAALIGRHTRIGDYSKISESSVDNFCILDDHVYIDRSAIMDGCRIGNYTHVTDSIIGRKAIIESSREHPTYIESNSVLGTHTN